MDFRQASDALRCSGPAFRAGPRSVPNPAALMAEAAPERGGSRVSLLLEEEEKISVEAASAANDILRPTCKG